MAKMILTIAGAATEGALAVVLTGWVLGTIHNVGQLGTQFLVAAVVALLTAIGGRVGVVR